MHGFWCYDNIARRQNVSEYLYSLYAWLLIFAELFRGVRCPAEYATLSMHKSERLKFVFISDDGLSNLLAVRWATEKSEGK